MMVRSRLANPARPLGLLPAQEYADDERSMLELVFAPCSPIAGGDVNWIAKKDEEIIDATMGEPAIIIPPK